MSGASRSLRRVLRPIEWVVLEDVALDARPDGKGELVAPTSARRVAEHLRLTAGAVARALARLRSAGLVTHARQAGPAGRFGLSAYVLTPVDGLDVVHVSDPDDAPPGPASPRLAPPRLAPPRLAPPRLVPPRLAPPHIELPRVVDAHMEADSADDEGPEPVGPAPRSPHKVADGSSAKRSGRGVARPAVAQLSMRANDAASLATRPAKDHSLTPTLLAKRWEAEARAVGLDGHEVVEAAVVGRRESAPELSADDVVAGLVDPEGGLCANHARFGEANVVERICAASAGRLTTEEILGLAGDFLASEHVVRLVPETTSATRRRPPEWSTAAHRELEDHVLERLEHLVDMGTGSEVGRRGRADRRCPGLVGIAADIGLRGHTVHQDDVSTWLSAVDAAGAALEAHRPPVEHGLTPDHGLSLGW